MSEQFTLIGLSDSPKPRLEPDAIAAIASHRVFAGGGRHHRLVGGMLPEGYRWITVAPPIDQVLQRLGTVGEPVVVFASGDPFFYGFGATLQKRFPKASLKCFPSFHALQMLAQHCMIPYQSMRHVSLTGRSWDELDHALIGGERLIGVLTDTRKTPAEVARRLLDYGYTGYRMTVGESLGGDNERVRTLPLETAAGARYSSLNCLLLQADSPPRRWFGIPESLFDGLPGRPNMITKMPLRLATLAALDLGGARHFWDIGFCTGSVAIEARLQFPGLGVTAFEVRPECEKLLGQNSRRFGAPGITCVMGDFLARDHLRYRGVHGVDAVFIGGHGDRLGEIFSTAVRHLAPGGRVVLNAVRESSASSFRAHAEGLGMLLDEPLRLVVDGHNPVFVMKATRPLPPFSS